MKHREIKDPFRVRRSTKLPSVFNQQMPKTVRGRVDRAREIHEELERLKPLHDEYDKLIMALANEKGLEKFGCLIEDNFLTKNSIFKGTYFRRFELKFWRKK